MKILTYLKRTIGRGWRMLNHPFVLASFFFILSIVFYYKNVLISKYSNILNYPHLVTYIWYLFLVFAALISSWLVYEAVKMVLRWHIVRTHDLSYWQSVDPVIQTRNWWRRSTFDLGHIRSVLGNFKLPNGCPYYNLIDNCSGSQQSLQADEKPIVVLKLPARKNLSVVDFMDLRLLRHVFMRGGHVIVLIIDGGRYSDYDEMVDAGTRTQHFVQRTLGRGTTVRLLSEVISGNAPEFLQFFLTEYIPFYVEHLGKNVLLLKNHTARTSYFTFPLIMRALQHLIPACKPVVMIQWKDRLDMWKKFSQLFEKMLQGLRVTGFIVGESFPDYEGKKLPTAKEPKDPMFTITTDKSEVHRRLLIECDVSGKTQYKISDEYVKNLALNLFGYDMSQKNSKELRDMFHKEFVKVQRCLTWHASTRT